MTADLSAERAARNDRIDARLREKDLEPVRSVIPMSPAQPIPSEERGLPESLFGDRGPGGQLSDSDKKRLRAAIRQQLTEDPMLTPTQTHKRLGEPLSLPSFVKHFKAVAEKVPAARTKVAEPGTTPTKHALQPKGEGARSIEVHGPYGGFSAAPRDDGFMDLTLTVRGLSDTAAWALLERVRHFIMGATS